MAVRDLTARNVIEDRLWVRIYIFIYIYFLFFFSIEFFEGVSRGGPYRWSMDRSVRWSVDPVRWTGPRTGGQCFRVTPVWLSDETAENMAAAKCRLHCVDYNCCGGHLTGILPSFLSVQTIFFRAASSCRQFFCVCSASSLGWL